MPKDQTIEKGLPQPLPDDTLMTTTELMKFLNLSRTKIWTLIRNESLPAFKFGGDYRFRKSEILQWMEQYRTQDIQDPQSQQNRKKKEQQEQ